MKLDGLLDELGWADNPAARDVLATEWTASRETQPSGALPFLLPESIAEACGILALPAGAQRAMRAVAESVSADAGLRCLAWHFHHCAYRSAVYPSWGLMARWPRPDALGAFPAGKGKTFYLLILLSGLPAMQSLYDERGIPKDVFHDTLLQLKNEVADLQRRERLWGLSGPERVQWHRFALRGELFRLGRLAFQFGLFRFRVRVFRHGASGAVLALSEAGVSFLRNGQANGPGRRWSSGEWTSEFKIAEGGVAGNPILPAGRALRRQVHLPAAEWEQVLARDDPALYVHFPDGGPLAHALCGKSFEQAAEFFPRHFPDRPYKCYCGGSWVLNARLQDLLPSSSNMVRFQREVYLLPYETHDMQLVDVILGGLPAETGRAPRATALQRALLDTLAAGQRDDARAGAFFLLPSDLKWGEQAYLRGQLPRNLDRHSRSD